VKAGKQLYPEIGFDRHVEMEWVIAALEVRSGIAERVKIESLLDASGLGAEAKAKTRTKLNRLWLEPSIELEDLAARSVAIFKESAESAVELSWGMAIVAYPFFGKVSEFIGRLTSIQGECSSLEVHRRMTEVFGDREGIKRATQFVLRTQVSWGVLDRVQGGTTLVRRAPRLVASESLIEWITEAALRYTRKPLSVSGLRSLPVLYPFEFSDRLAYVVSKSGRFDFRSDGGREQLVALRG
jgi:hypothetical protein